MKILVLPVLATCATLVAPMTALAQESPAPELLFIEVMSAHLPAARAGRETWDATPEERENMFCLLGSLVAGATSGGAAGAVTGRVCNALTPTARAQAEPSDPDAYVELNFGRGRPLLRTPVALNSTYPIWTYGFYAYTTDLPGSIVANVIGADPNDARDPIGDAVIRRDELLAAARDEALVEVQSPSGASLRLRVTNVSSRIDAESRRWAFDVPAASEFTHAPLDEGDLIPAGSLVRVRAEGRVQLGDPRRYPALGPEGSDEAASRRSNLPEFADERFGALMMVVGHDAASRQTVAVGRCVDFVATQSGVPTFIINDGSRRSNQGEFHVSLSIEPPLPGASLRPAGAPVACTPDEAVVPAAAGDSGSATAPRVTIRAGRLEIRAPRTKSGGAPWDGDGSAPDLVVVVTQNRQQLLRSEIAQNAWNVTLDLGMVDTSAGPLHVAVIDKDVISDDAVGSVLLDIAAGTAAEPLGAGGSVAFVGE